jgi:hypothetical protein
MQADEPPQELTAPTQPWQDPTGQYTGDQMSQWTDERRDRYQQRADRGNLAGQGGNFDAQNPAQPDSQADEPSPLSGLRGTGTPLERPEAQVSLTPGDSAGNRAAMQDWRRSNNPDQNKKNRWKWANANKKKRNAKNPQQGGLQKETMGPSGGMGDSLQKASMGRTSKMRNPGSSGGGFVGPKKKVKSPRFQRTQQG